MNKRILLGIDTDLSPSTQYALRITSELLEQSSPELRLVLLHVIPVPLGTRPAWGKSMEVFYSLPPTTQQHLQAERTLRRACVATRAMEDLARSGLLCCHSVKGEVRYLND